MEAKTILQHRSQNGWQANIAGHRLASRGDGGAFGRYAEAGRKVYELRYGVVARQALDAAVQNADWNAIDTVARDYRGTEAGLEAAWLRAEGEIGQGNPTAAAARLDRLMLESRARDRFGAAGWLLSAASWKAAGQLERASAAIELAKKYYPKETVAWSSIRINLSNEAASILTRSSWGISLVVSVKRRSRVGLAAKPIATPTPRPAFRATGQLDLPDARIGSISPGGRQDGAEESH